MFADLALHERLLKALDELGFTEPTPVQASAIPPALAGRDLRVIAQTGSGKTAAFVLPLLHRLLVNPRPQAGIRSLILLPTRELAQQTVKEIERFARYTFLKAGLVTGGEDFKVQAAMMRKLPDVLVGTPGRLIEHLEAGQLDLRDAEVLVLDEADRMLDMGFAEAVQRLAALCDRRQQTLLFSATAGGGSLREVIAAVLRDPLHLQLNRVSELNAGTRQQILTADDAAHKERLVQWLLSHETYDKAIVFTNTRAQADRLYGRLVAEQHRVFVLHGDKDQKIRRQAIDRLKQGAARVLVATDIAARGLDIDGLDLVINFDMPRSGTDYLHRIGRTGRAGGEGLAISLVCSNEWNLMASIERYLKQQFERRQIKELRGDYNGPKKLKASGKAVGRKQRKGSVAKAAAGKKNRPGRSSSERPATTPAAEGWTPPKRKKPQP